MAAPHVSGVLALLLAQGLSPSAAVERLLGTLDHSVPCGLGCRGRLDARAAVTAPAVPSTTSPVAVGAAASSASGDDDLGPVLPGVAIALALLAAGATVAMGRRATRR
jgi:subtilisin family serine protease